jgi:hypothetical protein
MLCTLALCQHYFPARDMCLSVTNPVYIYLAIIFLNAVVCHPEILVISPSLLNRPPGTLLTLAAVLLRYHVLLSSCPAMSQDTLKQD